MIYKVDMSTQSVSAVIRLNPNENHVRTLVLNPEKGFLYAATMIV